MLILLKGMQVSFHFYKFQVMRASIGRTKGVAV
jgi:hypothetical protein